MNRAPPSYHLISQALHWLLALMIVGSLGMGLYMTELSISPLRLRLYNWHKWAGMTILMLSALRLLWRLWWPPPPPLPMPAWQRRAASATHTLLYALFFAVPLAGWAYSSAAGFPVVLYGLLPLPDWVSANRDTAELLKAVHRTLAYALGTLSLLHVAAALKHHFIDHDGLLRRMWPARL